MMDPNLLTPMMRQYMEIKAQHPDEILFYRLGDFYEMFYEDAEIASEELDLVLTARNAGGGQKAPLCGVPYHSVHNYLAQLIKKGYSVAICEQMEDPKLAKDLVKREVVRIVTPGTLTEEDLLESDRNNYLLSVLFDKKRAAVAFVDLSTFEMKATDFEGIHAREDALSEIESLNPSEVLLLTGTDLPIQRPTQELSKSYFDSEEAETLFQRFLPGGSGIALKGLTASAAGALLRYVLETQKLGLHQKFRFEYYRRDEYLLIDPRSLQNLELFETLRDKAKKGSLLEVLDQTKTAAGARKLREWMRKPLRNRKALEDRIERVDILLQNDPWRETLRAQLTQVHDIERLLAKLVFGSMQPRELRSLGESLKAAEAVALLLEEKKLDRLRTYPLIYLEIEAMLRDELPATTREGGYIEPTFDEALKELQYLLDHGSSMLMEIEKKEKEASGIKNLRVRFNRVFGYFFEVTNSYQHLVPDHFIRKQTLAGSERYFTEELKELEEKILHAEEKKQAREREIYEAFLEELKIDVDELLQLAEKLAMWDVLANFAQVAKERNYVKPSFSRGSMQIEGGRHPVVERMIGESSFVKNDCSMKAGEAQFFIITGPNMAGKSTYLRQVALIALMAQMGSFVSADRAELPIFDRLFTRVGASDDLSQGQSTFMVEMSELAYILTHCTKNSLVILDEIGRGTSTFDGLAIAWSVVEYLTRKPAPKTLFATHYHELTEIEERIEGVRNFRIAVQKIGKELVLLRKILPGRAHQSFGIEAARLAGLPETLITRADEILGQLEANDIVLREEMQDRDHSEVLREIMDLAVDQITPLEALNILHQLSKKVKRETDQ